MTAMAVRALGVGGVASLSRFKGALVGAVLGDCVGGEFEGAEEVPMESVLLHLSGLDDDTKGDGEAQLNTRAVDVGERKTYVWMSSIMTVVAIAIWPFYSAKPHAITSIYYIQPILKTITLFTCWSFVCVCVCVCVSGTLEYSDDTAMARCVVQSLLTRAGFDEQDMARR